MTGPRAPAAAPPTGFRPHMPVAVKLAAALRLLGLDEVEWDHDPPLQLRVWDPEKRDTVPAANDPAHIVPRAKALHRDKTSGGATKARARGDITEIRKTQRMAKDQAAFRAKILGEPAPAPKRPKARIQSRPFPGRKKP